MSTKREREVATTGDEADKRLKSSASGASGSGASGSATLDKEAIAAALLRFFTELNEEKIANIPDMVASLTADNVDGLNWALRSKYGADLTDVPTFPPVGLRSRLAAQG